MESSSKTFSIVIGRIIQDFDSEYPTINSLQRILEQIQALHPDELTKYKKHITAFQRTIKEYGSVNRRLTDKQANNILKLLRNSISEESLLSKAEASSALKGSRSLVIHDTSSLAGLASLSISNTAGKFQIYNQPVLGLPTVPSSLSQAVNPWTHKKFESDDVIFPIVSNLLTNLDRNVMSSTLNTFVINYFEVLGPIMEEVPDLYLDLTCKIQSCLESHGWDFTGGSSAGGRGFRSPPNRNKLVEDLQKIFNDFF